MKPKRNNMRWLRASALAILFAAAGSRVGSAQNVGSFQPAGSLTAARRGHTATLLADGRVLIAGGWTTPEASGNSVNAAELYDPSTRTFSNTGNMTVSRRYHTATLLSDGRVLIAGGIASGNSALSSAELFDPALGTFSRTGGMVKARAVAMAVLLPNGKILIAGGLDGSNCTLCPTFLVGAEIYDPAAGTFSATGDMSRGSFEVNTAILLPDGRVFIGGSQNSELYDPIAGTFSGTGGWSAIGGDWADSQNLLMDGKVLVAGGDPDGFGSSAFAGVYNPATRVFTRTGDMNVARDLHTATLLPDGTVLIAGGQANGGATLTSAELYDPDQGIFRETGNMITPRCCHTATLLNTGQVLILGGIAAAQGYPSYQPSSAFEAEFYTPKQLKAAPVLFPLSPESQRQGAIWDAITGQIASIDTPTKVGAILSMYTTGLNEAAVIPPQVAIGGRLSELLYFGDAPGYPGYQQINFRVPAGIVPNSAVPVRLTYLGRSSNEVSIAVR